MWQIGLRSRKGVTARRGLFVCLFIGNAEFQRGREEGTEREKENESSIHWFASYMSTKASTGPNAHVECQPWGSGFPPLQQQCCSHCQALLSLELAQHYSSRIFLVKVSSRPAEMWRIGKFWLLLGRRIDNESVTIFNSPQNVRRSELGYRDESNWTWVSGLLVKFATLQVVKPTEGKHNWILACFVWDGENIRFIALLSNFS